MGFTKLDYGIIDSSLWDEPSDVLKVFQAFWTKSDSEGIVNATYNAMFRTANLCDKLKNPLPVSEFDFALNVLLAPDISSRSKEHDGRRIIRLEESKWLIVNYKKYRDHTYSNSPESVRKREYRSKIGTQTGHVPKCPGHSISVSVSESVSVLKEDHKKKTFTKPTLEDVQQYCKSRGNSVDAQSFIDFYESKGWMIGKNSMKDWQAAVRTWERGNNTTVNKQQEQTVSPYRKV